MKATHLFKAFNGINGTAFVTLDTLTSVRLMFGANNPQQGHITKRTVGAQVMVFQNTHGSAYEAMVRRRMVAEGLDPDFKAKPRAWGTRIPDTPIVDHNGKHYLEVIFLKPGRVEYLFKGRLIDPDYITGLPDETREQGGQASQVVIRCFAADSIQRVSVNGKVFA